MFSSLFAGLCAKKRAQIALFAAAAAVFAPAAHAQILATGPGYRSLGSASPNDFVSVLSSPAPAASLRGATQLGPVSGQTPLQLSLTLPLRNQPELDQLLKRLYDPQDALYHQFLTTEQFRARFAPIQQDYDAVAAFAKSQGLTVGAAQPTRTAVSVSGPASLVESIFQTGLTRYQLRDSRVVYANDTTPKLPRSVASKVSGILGLDSITVRRPYFHVRMPQRYTLDGILNPHNGSGGAGGLTPRDIKVAYNLDKVPYDGTGQSIGLFQLGDYADADITKYATTYGLGTPKLVRIATGTFVLGTLNSVQTEVTLDISMVLAVAPKATIRVYEGTNDATGILAVYQKMADENLAKTLSASYGSVENPLAISFYNSETAIFKQYAAQGQSYYNSSGDNGAYDDNATVSVDEPADNPFVTAVGGTSLTTNGPGGAYASETVWSRGTLGMASTAKNGAGGGGTSLIFAKPDYQLIDANTNASNPVGASATMRDEPDISLNADPGGATQIVGYDIFSGGAELVVGGTSASCPLWNGFTALVNQALVAKGYTGTKASLGFANPPIYKIARSAAYGADFHDIVTGDNLYYLAKTGYDDATGWGSFNGANLLATLAPDLETAGPVGTLTGTVTFNGGPPPVVTVGTTPTPVTATVTITSVKTGTVYGTATTDSAGNFTLPTPSLLTYTLTVTAPGYSGRALGGISVNAAQTINIGTINLITTNVFAASKYQMISVPYDYTGVGTFATALGIASPVSAGDTNLYNWQPSLDNYVQFPAYPADTFHLGYGYWLIERGTGTTYPGLSIAIQGNAAPTNQPVSLALTAGWNQIGDPFFGAEPLTGITIKGTPITTSSAVTLPLYSYTPTQGVTPGGYTAVGANGTLQPFVGYWIYLNQPATLTFAPQTAGNAPPPPAP